MLRTDVDRLRNGLDHGVYGTFGFMLGLLPSLGFIGTVLGMGNALLAADGLFSAADRQRTIGQITEELGFAFDTTRQRAILYGHAFRNAMIPLVTLVGLTIPDLFGGALIIENVFSYPGVGQLTINSLNQSDYSVAMAAVMILALLTVLGNLLADILYGVMDPRVRYD